ncbi:MAG: hypothetical protein P8Y66_04555 [Nitrospirota bacterium]
MRNKRPKKSQTLEARTWYGPRATVVIGPGFRHSSGWGTLRIPHPPVVNWLLRRGLREKNRLDLAGAHEMAHMETAPFFLLYAAISMAAASRAGGGALSVAAALVGAQAVWEMLSEALIIALDRVGYRLRYAGARRLPRLLFWCSMGLLAVLPWVAGAG